ncbi:DUF4829 domain-containing protein [Microbispora sp. NPDC049633]|uniref:DUF4829 domain-containing protein n=1 Tax=Microbispora sp. NPDC049633 TaxID=3154355 RepID=UPI00341C05EB
MIPARVAGGLVLAVVGLTLVAGCRNGETKTSLPDSASPRQVVAAYLDAINAHDVEAGRRLSTRRFAEREENVTGSLFDDAELSDVKIEVPRPEPGYGSRNGGRHREAVYVPVSFTLRHSDDVSMPNGPTVWGYVLVRAGEDEPWRIDDAGVG